MTRRFSLLPHVARFLAAGMLLTAPAFACRIILPPPHPWPPPRPIPPSPRPLQAMDVKSHRAEIEIDGPVASVHVAAVFHNPNPRRIEGTYFFPIGPGAAVNSFAMTVNGRTLEAELLPAGKARQIYEDIVRRQKDPALLEYIDQGMLKARVFPIEPHQDVEVELTYEQRVREDGSLSRLAYPLLSAKPEGEKRLQSLVLDVTIKGRGSLKTVFTPGFDSRVTRPQNGQARITYEASNYLPDRDFEIAFSRQKGKVGLDMLTYRKGDEGYFMLMISPASELQAEEIQQKDISFVIDTSGSMSGDKIKQAKQALRFCINSLTDGDAFNVVAFSTDVMPFKDMSVPASAANREAALGFVDGLKARGGTAIDDALAFALKAESAKNAVPMIVFLTDGLPTIGEVDPETIIKNYRAKAGKQRVFAFGVGYDVNTQLLDSIAAASKGYTSYVPPKEDLELALSDFYEKVSSPVMTDLKIDSGGVRLTQLSPPDLPDLFKGSQVTLLGRYDGKGEKKLTVSGEVNGTRERFMVTADLKGDSRNTFIPRMWAVSRIGYLLSQIRIHGKNSELTDEVKRLGRDYGILTPYTSFLVVEEGLAPEARKAARRELDELSAAAPAPGSRGYRVSGQDAVETASADRAMQAEAGTAPSAPAESYYGRQAEKRLRSVRGGEVGQALAKARDDQGNVDLGRMLHTAHDKTFYYRAKDGFFYDSAIPTDEFPTPDHDVKAWSDEFFALLRRFPKLKLYLGAGDKLVLILDGKVIRVTD